MLKKLSLAAALCCAVATPTLAHDLELTGVVRDFKRGDKSGGHPDFETAGSMGRFGHVQGLVTMELDQNGKPVYNPTRPNKDTIQSAASLAQWYKDVPGVNLSAPLTLTLWNGQEEPGGVYSYINNAFWPIDGQMFGNQGLNKNFHFTFELHTEFSYEPGQKFTFIGDDDVWVYVNGKRVIDLGGVHSAVTGSVLLLDGKAFVEKRDYAVGGMVKSVSSSMASDLANKWNRLGLPGNCPVVQGDRYIDMPLSGDSPDVRCQFDNTSVTVRSAENMSKVVLKFDDNTTQVFDNLTGYMGSFAGTGAYAGKVVKGCWVRAGNTAVQGFGHYFSNDGASSWTAKLDFFFAERHTTQSNFRIDTSIRLKNTKLETISALYD